MTFLCGTPLIMTNLEGRHVQSNAKAFERRLSATEYYHASIGLANRSLDSQRKTLIGFEIRVHEPMPLILEKIKLSFQVVATAHPPIRLKLKGHWWWSRWVVSDSLPSVRQVEWDLEDLDDVQSIKSLFSGDLNFTDQCGLELVLVQARNQKVFVFLHALHAVIDGLGALHLINDLFRVLNGHPALGSTLPISDCEFASTQLKVKSAVVCDNASVNKLPVDFYHFAVSKETVASSNFSVKFDRISGSTSADQLDFWTRRNFSADESVHLSALVDSLRRSCPSNLNQDFVFAVPVNLRKYLKYGLTCANFSSILHVPYFSSDNTQAFRRRLKCFIDNRKDLQVLQNIVLLKLLPKRLLSILLGRSRGQPRGPKVLESFAVSYLGEVNPEQFKCKEFEATDFIACPLGGSVFVVVFKFGLRLSFVFNFPTDFDHSRISRFLNNFEQTSFLSRQLTPS